MKMKSARLFAGINVSPTISQDRIGLFTQQHSAEDTGDDYRVAALYDPLEQVDAERKTDHLLTNAHGDEHF